MINIDLSLFSPILINRRSNDRTELLPLLHAAQKIYGFIPEGVASEIAKTLDIPLSEVYGVIEFYSLFFSQPANQTVLHVCNDPVCSMAGSNSIFAMIKKFYLPAEGTPSFEDSLVVEQASCLGLCAHAPAVLINREPKPSLAEYTLDALLSKEFPRPHTKVFGRDRILTRNCGSSRTIFFDDYVKSGGYQALRKALSLQPSAIIEEVKISGLLGRGGAAFPTGIKWESVNKSTDPVRYLVCNGDEAEPGTFKDRVLLEDDPHQLIEGVIIASYAIKANKAYVFIRGEYEYAFRILSKALEETYRAGFLGNNLAGSGFNLEVELRQGAGAYICGEETALFESIEGKRGYPRIKPPFPTTSGLFGKPTAINNVETLCNIPHIILHSAKEYRKNGTEKSAGTKLFCLSGDVVHPGLYEAPFGITIRELIFELAGGVSGGAFQAALIGGAAGAFLKEEHLDLALTYETLRPAGLPMGSGVLTILNDTRNIVDILVRLAHFFAEESCGKCFPCQLGTQIQYEILSNIASGIIHPGDIQRLVDLGMTMTDASLCGLGQTAASAILSAIKLWPDHLMSGIVHER